MLKWKSGDHRSEKGGKRQAIKENNSMYHMISFYGKKGNTNKVLEGQIRTLALVLTEGWGYFFIL